MREKKAKGHTVSIDSKDLYQYMIAECRYGYTRHNHLMPWGAFNHCYTYLPKLAKTDKECAARTATQLAEEAISELRMRTFGKNEEFSIFQKDANGVTTELGSKWEPMLYRHSITSEFEAHPGMEFSDRDGNIYGKFSASEENGMLEVTLPMMEVYPKNYLFKLYYPAPEKPGWYESLGVWGDKPIYIPNGGIILLTVDKNKEGTNLKDMTDFINYCLEFAQNLEGDLYRPPYNYDMYEEYLRDHPLPIKSETK